MTVTLGFDIYGTLIDTHGMIVQLKGLLGDCAADFSKTWREKQLEYTFRRGLMGHYANFAVCTRDALEYACSAYQAPITDEQKTDLLRAYQALPAFDDVIHGLQQLSRAGFQMYAFSNGIKDSLETLLGNAGIRNYFLGVVSVDDVKTFKPSPSVYQHFLNETNSSASRSWLISSNPFDVIGAVSCSMNAAWVRRSDTAIFDPWGIEPTLTVNSLSGLAEKINEIQH